VKVSLRSSKERFPGKNSNMRKIFNYGINISSTSQGFYVNHDSAIVNIPPNVAVDISDFRSITKAILPVPNVIEYWRKKGTKRFFLRRTFAMGDVLMLVPIVRYLRTLGFDPCIKTVQRYFNTIRRFNIEIILTGFGPDGAGIELDKTVELDHGRPEIQNLHRIEIYLSAMGFNKFPKTLDWGYDKKNFPTFEQLKSFKFKKKDYVIFHGSGSTKAKTLPKVRIEGIINALNKKGIKVIYIGNPIQLDLKEPEMTEVACVKYNFLQLFPIFEHTKAAIVMDSGPLWVSHFTKTPIVGIFGPTNPNTRLTYHPLYPEKVRVVETNKHMDCKRCYEIARRCNFRFDCFHIPLDTLFNDLYPKLEEVWA